MGDGDTLHAFAKSPHNTNMWGSGPLLVVRPNRTSGSKAAEAFVFDTPSRATLASTSSTRLSSVTADEFLPKDALVLPVRKTDSNPFPMISLGRARNNDICIPDSSVSKVHAYFVAPDKTEARWRIKDAKSLNGTILMIGSGPRRLLDDEVVALDVGSELRVGVMNCLFTDHETLLNAVSWASKAWKA